jgi:hypothetical protein
MKGWRVVKIIRVDREAVTLDTGISFYSPCFAGAKVGDIWAAKLEDAGPFVFGMIREAYLLETSEF